MVRITDRPDMTLDVYHGRKNNNTTMQCHTIIEVKVPILFMFEVCFTQNSEADFLLCGASSGSEPSLFQQ